MREVSFQTLKRVGQFDKMKCLVKFAQKLNLKPSLWLTFKCLSLNTIPKESNEKM